MRSSTSHGDNMTVISCAFRPRSEVGRRSSGMKKVDEKVDHKRSKYLVTTVNTNAHESVMKRTIVDFLGH